MKWQSIVGFLVEVALYALLFEISKEKAILENSNLFSHESITNSVCRLHKWVNF